MISQETSWATDTAASDEEVESLLQRAKLLRSRITSLSGELTEDIPNWDVDRVTAEVRGEYRGIDRGFQCRLSIDLPIRIKHRRVGWMGATVVQTFSLSDGPHPSQGAVSIFLQRRGIPDAIPYLSDAIRTMSKRLGLGQLSLG